MDGRTIFATVSDEAETERFDRVLRFEGNRIEARAVVEEKISA
jgi:hypothetical protein